MPSSNVGVAPSSLRERLRFEAHLLRLLLFTPTVPLLLVAFLGGLVWAYQTTHTYTVDVGSPQDQAYTENFHARLQEGARTYRWSDVYGYVLFPGLGGSRPLSITLTLDPGREAPVTVIVNGEQFFSRPLRSGWQTVGLQVDATHARAFLSRDTTIEVRAPDFRSENAPTEPKGVKVSNVTVSQGDGGFITPPYARLAAFSGALLLLYLFVGRTLLPYALPGKARLWGSVVSVIAGLLCVFGLAQNHVALAADANHLLITLGMMPALLIGVNLVSGGLAAGLTPLPRHLLALSVAIAFGLRYGGMALPQSVIIDMDWHMKWLHTLLVGDWQSLYFPGGLSSVPREWGLDVLIPKSPLFYVAATPFSILPFDLETLVKWLTCLLDSSVVLAVFALGRRLTCSAVVGVAGAALYAVMPLAFRAFAYGILPTIFAQWLAVLVFLAVLRVGTRRSGLTYLLGFTLLLTLALLGFPTVALFVTLALLATAAAWSFSPRRRSDKSLWQIPACLLAAWLPATWAYYGIYISPVLTSISALLAPKPGGGSTVRWPGGLPELLGWTGDYLVSVLPLVLAVTGVGLMWARRRVETRTGALLVAWLTIAPVFLLVNLRVDMIGKHLFFTMAPVAVLGGLVIWLIRKRGGWSSTLASLVLAALSWQAILFWVERLVRASS